MFCISTEESTKEETTTEAPASQKTTADSVNVTSNDADITKVTDEKSAVAYYAQAANVVHNMLLLIFRQ